MQIKIYNVNGGGIGGMFTKIRLKNFYSFKDITFDLHCAPKRYKHLAIVYGENGSGKTNLMSGLGVFIDLMRTMDVRDRIEQILYDQEHPENSEDAYPKLSAQILARALRSSESLFNECRMIGSSEPVCLQYEFLIHGKKGMYLVEFGKEGIIHERLEYVIEKRRGVYFDLTAEDKAINKTLFKSDTLKNDIADQIKRFWGKHTFLAIFIHEINDKAEQYIQEGVLDNFLVILNAFSRVSCSINSNNNPHALISRPSKGLLLTNIKSGTIHKNNKGRIERTAKVLTQLFKAINSDNQELYYEMEPDGPESVHYQLRIKKMISGEIRDFSFEYESYGNHQIIKMLPLLLRALEGETVILDESDSGIHDLLYSKIISEAVPYIQGQLILTTHNTLLLEIRDIKDALYVIRENEEADRSIVAIIDAGERIYQQTSIRNKYLNGAYGGAPRIETINFQKMLDIAEDKAELDNI